MQRLRNIFGKLREGRAGRAISVGADYMLTGIENAAGLRVLAYSVLGLITSQSMNESDTSNYDPYLEQGETISSSSKDPYRVNNQNAWCWRDNCPGSHSISVIKLL